MLNLQNALLTVSEMPIADDLAVQSGLSVVDLMENAGAAVAREIARRWTGPIMPLSPEIFQDAGLVVDALFGAGLSRPLDDQLVELLAAAARAAPIVAVDVPSGTMDDTG